MRPMTDHLDLEAIKERLLISPRHTVWDLDETVRALISEVERLQADVERKDEALGAAIYHVENCERVLEGRAVRDFDESKLAFDLRARAALSESPTETKGENG